MDDERKERQIRILSERKLSELDHKEVLALKKRGFITASYRQDFSADKLRLLDLRYEVEPEGERYLASLTTPWYKKLLHDALAGIGRGVLNQVIALIVTVIVTLLGMRQVLEWLG